LPRTFNLFGVVVCLTAVGCASLPQTFTRLDAQALDPKQLSTDEAICRGEIKNNLSAGSQTTMWGPTEDAITVYSGCMAQRGYKTSK
jgi:hypothetical protein